MTTALPIERVNASFVSGANLILAVFEWQSGGAIVSYNCWRWMPLEVLSEAGRACKFLRHFNIIFYKIPLV